MVMMFAMLKRRLSEAHREAVESCIGLDIDREIADLKESNGSIRKQVAMLNNLKTLRLM